MTAPNTYRAFTAGNRENGYARTVEDLALEPLAEGSVRVAVSYSSVNFKDNLAASENGRVARLDPIVPGIDLAGEITEGNVPGATVGTQVIAHGYELGVSRNGGYAELVDVPASWLVPLPAGMSLRQSMVVGTAGFTAALSVFAVVDHGITADDGPVLVTGATGGVGSVAVAMLAKLGYEVHASTGRSERAAWLQDLGATEVIDRLPSDAKPLGKETWSAVIDSVGGTTLQAALASLKYGGIAAASGNTGGASLNTSVFPFILRAVRLAGIDSVQVPIERRRAVWGRIAEILEPKQYELLEGETYDLSGVSAALDAIKAGRTEGRSLIVPGSSSQA